MFQPGTIFDKFPFLLPNLICAVVVVISLVVGILFLEETMDDKKHRRDIGLDCGRWFLARLGLRLESPLMRKQGYFEETLSLLVEDENPRDYQSGETAPYITCSEAVSEEALPQVVNEESGHCTTFTPQIMLNILSLGLLA